MEPFALQIAGESHWALNIAVLGALLGLGQGCGQPSNFANARGNLIVDEQDNPGSSIDKKGLVALEASSEDPSRPREKTNSQTFISPAYPFGAGQPEKSSEPSDSVGRPEPASPPAVEGEIADTPMPIAGAFLTCWTGIDPTVGDAHARDSGQTKIGCGFLTEDGKKADVLVPMDQWRIYSIAGVKVDQPIAGIAASNSNLWSVEFSLPTRDVAVTRIAVKNAPRKVLFTDAFFLVTSISKAKKVGGATNPAYFHIGQGPLSVLSDCPNAAAIKAQPAIAGIGVSIKVSASRESQTQGRLAIVLSGICGTTIGPPVLTIASKNSSDKPVFTSRPSGSNQTIEVALPPGDYNLAFSGARGLIIRDNIAIRGLVVVPLLGNVTAGPTFALP